MGKLSRRRILGRLQLLAVVCGITITWSLVGTALAPWLVTSLGALTILMALIWLFL